MSAPLPASTSGCTLDMLTSWLREIDDQPPWRKDADEVADYFDGNQRNAEVLQQMKARGMPVITENHMGQALRSVIGAEAANKLDWRVTPDGVDDTQDDLAEAVTHKLTEAERNTNADDAISDAYASQSGVGLGWVEVSRAYDPISYPYRVTSVHRNEIWWDFTAKSKSLEDAAWLMRRRWVHKDRAKAMFPQQAELIERAATGWNDYHTLLVDGGASTDLAESYEQERGWSIEEQEWRNTERRRVCLHECWYRVQEQVEILRSSDGRNVVYDQNNRAHQVAVAIGSATIFRAAVSRMRLAWWMGPHRLHDGPTPFPHQDFPYVPFFAFREDRTAIPYGLGRAMLPLQDEVNARLSRMQWGMGAVRVTRTAGAVEMSDDELRSQVARPDADIVLSDEAMRQGGVFRVERDYQLNEQQFKRYMEAKEALYRVAGIQNSFMGRQDGGVTSGVGIQALTQQSQQNLADLQDNMRFARKKVGDLLLSLVLEDMKKAPSTVVVPGDATKEAKTVRINARLEDGSVENDLSRVRMLCVLSDVPGTHSFRGQQFMAMSEVIKSVPPDMQAIAVPFLLELSDSPNKREMIQALRRVTGGEQITPEMVQEQIQQALQQSGRDMEAQRLEIERMKVQIQEFAAQSKAHTDYLRAEADWLRAETDARRDEDAIQTG